jgi:hypothetical protein
MRIAILAHHVAAHESMHPAVGLMELKAAIFLSHLTISSQRVMSVLSSCGT